MVGVPLHALFVATPWIRKMRIFVVLAKDATKLLASNATYLAMNAARYSVLRMRNAVRFCVKAARNTFVMIVRWGARSVASLFAKDVLLSWVQPHGNVV